MRITHFDVKKPKVNPPDNEEWEQLWSGYYWMTKCVSPQSRQQWADRDDKTRSEGKMTETDFQQDCLLSILADIKKKHVNIFELGAGWGRITLALAGAIDHRVIPLYPESYRFLAIEGEPSHYQWAKEHFETQGINATILQAAVSNKNGYCRFLIQPEPESHYGQGINPLVSRRKIPSPWNIRNYLARKTIKIPSYTIDRLIQAYGFDHVDLIQMDVQSAEYQVIQGASESIKNDMIDYFLISVHVEEFNNMLKNLLYPKFDLIVDIPRNSVGAVDSFPPIKCGDGMQLYKRKGL